MATLSVWKFPGPNGAETALDTLGQLEEQELITVHDAAVVSWPAGRKQPATHQTHDPKTAGAMGGAFWGLLFGLIFFVPLLGLAVGAAAGALGGALADVGIDDDFIEDVRKTVTPGTSALFVLTSDAVQERVVAEFRRTGAELIQTNLSAEDETRLRQAFAAE